MKNINLEKINKFGKIGYSITKFLYPISIVLLVLNTVMTLFFASIPNDFIEISNVSNKTIHFNLIDLDETISINEEVLEKVKKENVEFTGLFDSLTYRLIDMKTNGHDLSMISEFRLDNKDVKDYAMVLFIYDIGAIFEIIVLYYIRKLFKIFKDCSSPFEDDAINILSKISTSLIPLAIYYLISDIIINIILTNQISIIEHLDISGFVIISFIYILIAIFKYGVMLQVESDETL